MSRGSKRSQGWKDEWANQDAFFGDDAWQDFGRERAPSPVASASSNHSVRNTRPRYHSPAPAAAAAAPAAAHAMPSSASSARPRSRGPRGAASAPSRVQRRSPIITDAIRAGTKRQHQEFLRKQARLHRQNQRTRPAFEEEEKIAPAAAHAAPSDNSSRSSGRAPSLQDDVRSEAVGRAGRNMRALRKKPARRPGARPVNERDYRKFDKRGSPSQFKRRHGER